MGKASQGKTRINGTPSLIEQAKANVEARTQHTKDREDLVRMRDRTELRLWKLKIRMPVSAKRQGEEKFSTASGIYAETIREYETVIEMLKDAIADHEKILLSARGIKPRSSLKNFLQSFANHILKICAKWHVLEVWYKGARNLLMEIKENAEKLPRFSLAPA